MEDVLEEIGGTKYLIVISHLAQGESPAMSKRRLYNAKYFFLTAPNSRPPDSILTAEGEKVSGKAYIDFFVGGDLSLRVFLNKDADFIVTACIADPPNSRCQSPKERIFYPCRLE